MMMNSLIISTLKPLGIKTFFLKMNERELNSEEYIMFSIYNESDDDVFDDEPTAIKYSIALNYWYEKSTSYGNVRQIKKLLKDAGFTINSDADLYDEDLPSKFGRTMKLSYTEYLK